MTPKEIIEQAAEICGGRTPLAAHLDVSTSSIDKWRTLDAIPAKHCTILYRLTSIPLHKLNPVFPYELTLGTHWEERIVARLRRLQDRDLLKDIETMLDLEVGP